MRGTGEFRMKKLNKKKCDRKKELAIGQKIEMEHASLFPKGKQKEMASKIAEQHISEFGCYYSEGLISMEKKFKIIEKESGEARPPFQNERRLKNVKI